MKNLKVDDRRLMLRKSVTFSLFPVVTFLKGRHFIKYTGLSTLEKLAK